MSIKDIRKAVKRSKSDLRDGTIIAWMGSGRFHYAAIKTPVGWYTTASNRAGMVLIPKVATYDELLEILGRAETSNVRVIGLDDGTVVE